MEELYLPVLSHFQNGNTWIASVGRLRFKITPADGVLAAETWEGPWSYEFSRVEECKSFPEEDEGIEQARAWLAEEAARVNARPERTPAEDKARRIEPKKKEKQ